MTNKEQKEVVARHNAMYEAMLRITTPLLSEANNPIEALDIIAHFTQSMLLAVCTTAGMPVKKNIDVALSRIGRIDNIEYWERVSREKNEQHKIIKQSTAIIGMDGKPIKKGGAQ